MSDVADSARQGDAVGLDEAARRLGVSTTTLRRRIAAGAVPGAFREPGPRGVWRLPLDVLADGAGPEGEPQPTGGEDAGQAPDEPAAAAGAPSSADAAARGPQPAAQGPDGLAAERLTPAEPVGGVVDVRAPAPVAGPPEPAPDGTEPVGVLDLLGELTRLTSTLTEERRLLGLAAEERESVRIEALRARRMLQHALEDREDARIESARLETMLEHERARVEELRAEVERLRAERDRLQRELDGARRPRFRR
ncbi:MAG: hypothetical protein R3C15_05315 [Thermoleophilia bacterium]